MIDFRDAGRVIRQEINTASAAALDQFPQTYRAALSVIAGWQLFYAS
jgi:hypothetical protein